MFPLQGDHQEVDRLCSFSVSNSVAGHKNEPEFSLSMFSSDDFLANIRARSEAAGLWMPKVFLPRDPILSQGQPCSTIFVQISGLTKLTYVSADGDEWIKSFVVDGGVFGGLATQGKAESRFGATAIEECRVVQLPAAWIKDQAEADASFASLIAQFTSWLADRKQLREEALLCDTAEARYRSMLEHERTLLARLPQGDIARFLRITPIAFSRIKRRMSNS